MTDTDKLKAAFRAADEGAYISLHSLKDGTQIITIDGRFDLGILTERGVAVRPKTGCYECGREYGNEHGFPDLIVPDEVWDTISPTGDAGGLLCPSCMCKKALQCGLENVRATFESGPFCRDDVIPASDPIEDEKP